MSDPDITGAEQVDDIVGDVPLAEPSRDGGEALVGDVVTVESLIEDLDRVTTERDGYMDDVRRVTAEFANFRKQTERRYQELIGQAASSLVDKLLPVFDAFDAALAHGAVDVKPIYDTLFSTLEREGLARVPGEGAPFDPAVHEAVLHEPADDGAEATVTEVMRPGYEWNGRVVRPAMVKVRG